MLKILNSPLLWTGVLLAALFGFRIFLTVSRNTRQVISMRFDENGAQTIPNILEHEKSALYMITDPVGHKKAGNAACEIAFQTIKEIFYKKEPHMEPNDFLKYCCRTAHLKVSASMNLNSGGCSIALIYIKDKILYWLSAGDISIYLCGRELVQLNQLDLYKYKLPEAVLRKQLNEKTVKNNLLREEITAYLGHDHLKEVSIDASGHPLDHQEQILAVTGAVSKCIPPLKLEKILLSEGNSLQKLRKIEQIYAAVETKDEKDKRAEVLLGTNF